MKITLKTLAKALGFVSTLALVGCGQSADNANTIKVGVIAGAEEQVAEIAAQVAKKEHGIDVELITFSDYITPNAALDEGTIDINAFQHKPYLDQQIQDRGYQFDIAGNTLVYPIAGYSNKIKTVDDIAQGDKIAVPNDPTNLGRALLLLEKQGLIEVKDEAGLKATVLDITSNPKQLDIIELEAAQLPRSLDDVTLAVINTTFASAINLSPEKDGVFVENKESPYVNIIVARKDNVQSEKVQKFVQSYQSDTVFNAANDIFKGGVVKGW